MPITREQLQTRLEQLRAQANAVQGALAIVEALLKDEEAAPEVKKNE